MVVRKLRGQFNCWNGSSEVIRERKIIFSTVWHEMGGQFSIKTGNEMNDKPAGFRVTPK
jgi:hypothetical protein